MRRCRICNLPEGKFNVVLDDEGVCNYCDYFNRNRPAVLNLAGREQRLTGRFEKLKGKYEYDAIAGLSGGKDSTYVLCRLVKKYQLRVLAITFDNGFLTDFARQSIANTVARLGVDHFYYKPNWETHRKLYQAALRKLGDPCIACASGGYFLAIKGCYEKRVPFFVHGRTPFQLYRNFYEHSPDVHLALIKGNLAEHSFAALSNLYRAANERIRQSIGSLADNLQDAGEITDEFFVDSGKLTPEFAPELLAYFLFEEYDEEKIKQYLADTLDWKRPARDNLMGHYDCAIHDAAGCLFKELHDVDVLEPDVAVMVRFGAITKEKAGELIRLNEPTVENTEKSFDALCALCEVRREDLRENMVALKRARVGKQSEHGR